MLLSSNEIDNRLRILRSWKLDGKAIKKTYIFSSFLESIKFVNDVSGIAEKLQHHPDIKINYASVEMSSTTHSAGGLTAKDFYLAEKIEDAYKRMRK